MNKRVRVRFAPSPTGALHIGGVRTALYNYLFAKKMGGDFLLRIEDTDQTRFVPNAENYIKESLDWLGLSPSESPWNGGSCAPYRQSERKQMYIQYAQQLINDDKAYYAFDTPEELEAMRERLKEDRVLNPQYNGITRLTMKNSLSLSAEEVKSLMDAGTPYVIRLKVPRKEEIRLNDLVRGWVKVLSSDIDDKILMKSDGMPSYHLANVVDDHLMGISHVIRGEEWLPSAPCHVLLYQYLGWEDTMPQFAHLPLLLKPDGNGKLSKRSADQLGFPIFPLNWLDPETQELSLGFKEKGYLPEALINFLAFLGWNPGTEQELFSLDQLVEAFSLDRINKAGAKFDIEKLNWFNQQYLKAGSEQLMADILLTYSKEKKFACTAEGALLVANLFKERVAFPQEIIEKSEYLFKAPTVFDTQVIDKKWTADVVKCLGDLVVTIAEGNNFSGEQTKSLLSAVAQDNQVGLGKLMQPLRTALTGEGNGPELVDIIDFLGKEAVLNRLNYALLTIKVPIHG
jgi:glutamyl-tRNA synthetase